MAKHANDFGSADFVQIYQDDPFENAAPMTSHAPMPTVTKPARRPLGSAASNANVVFNPPFSHGGSYSPHKTKSSSPRSPLKTSQGNLLHAVAMAPPLRHRASTDSLQKKPVLSRFKTQKQAVEMTDFGKENVHPQLFPSTYDFYPNSNGKRGLMDPAPIGQGQRPAKKAKVIEDTLPPHDSFPPIADDGLKPQHSYAQLIGMAILRSPLRRLTLSQIYKWISDNFSFYGPTDAGWQNSIRHNLSLHKNFIKIERPKDDPGKGNYWTIEPGTEMQFLKEKPTRKSIPSGENVPVMSTRLEPSRPPTVHIQEPSLPPPPMSQPSLPCLLEAETETQAPELSSDATIPVSDNAAPEEAPSYKAEETDAAVEFFLESPVPATMHSSPPVPRTLHPRSRTPPGAGYRHGSSVPRPRKRKKQSNDDSGYISSLESSVIRPGQSGYLLTSEADRPANRPRDLSAGRAEQEIARIRFSSPHSPTNNRSKTAFGPISSSPLQQATESRMLGPLTPNVRIAPPARPPPSASPNTNLRQHREKMQSMLQSPLRKVIGIGDEPIPHYSPAFNLDGCIDMAADTAEGCNFNIGGFGLYNSPLYDVDGGFPLPVFNDPAANGSPVKRSAKRARLDRTQSTSALGSVDKRSATSAPMANFVDASPVPFYDTPSKAFEGLSSPLKQYQQSPSRQFSASNFMAFEGDDEWPTLSSDTAKFVSNGAMDDDAEFGGLDILQGFEKIGGAKASKVKKPLLSRSLSTQF